MRNFLIVLIFAFVLIPFNSAADLSPHVRVVAPLEKTILEGDTIDLGIVGPGQKIEMEISRSSNIFNFKGEEETWDRLRIDSDSLPFAWLWEYSKRYEANPKAFVIIDKEAPDGEYSFKMHTERDYSTASKYPVNFNVKVKVSRDVFSLTVISKFVKGGVDQPSEFKIKLTNLGSANDVFDLKVLSGLPKEWAFHKEVFVPHNSEKIITYEVVPSEQSDLNLVFGATSLSSKAIASQDTAVLQSRSDLAQEMKSVGNGVLLFPYIEQAIYYVLGFIANNFL